MITDMLKQVITEGTGTRASISGLYQAGKTGTNAYPSDIASKFPSSASMDSWFNGYTKHYSIIGIAFLQSCHDLPLTRKDKY